MKKQQGLAIHYPLVIMYPEGPDPNGNIICAIHPRSGDHYGHYGILICDLVRHVANAFGTQERDVWYWVDKERHNPTCKVREQAETTLESLATENGVIRKL